MTKIPPKNYRCTCCYQHRTYFRRSSGGCAGFSIVELVVALTVTAIVAAIAIPAYSNYVEKTRITKAITEIMQLQVSLSTFYIDNYNKYPDGLAELGTFAQLKDPWGRPYQYYKIEGSSGKGKGNLRKDRFLNPLNSDYDLYSMGADGASQKQLTAKESRDDIVRCNNGGFLGLASEFDP